MRQVNASLNQKTTAKKLLVLTYGIMIVSIALATYLIFAGMVAGAITLLVIMLCVGLAAAMVRRSLRK
jgi:uncharacterized membrane-anchored protein